MERLPIIGVMGSGAEEHRGLAEPLGALVARIDCHLLTGGRTGAMEAVARGFCQIESRRGRSIGVLPEGARPNPYVEIPIYTQLSSANDRTSADWQWSRNHVNVRSSTLVVALPGAAGTASELELAAAGEYARPCLVFLGTNGSIADLSIRNGTIITETGVAVPVAEAIEDVERFVRDNLPGTD